MNQVQWIECVKVVCCGSRYIYTYTSINFAKIYIRDENRRIEVWEAQRITNKIIGA